MDQLDTRTRQGRTKEDYAQVIQAHLAKALETLNVTLGSADGAELLAPVPCAYDLPARLVAGLPVDLPRVARDWSEDVHGFLFPVRAPGARSGRLAVLTIPTFVEPDRAEGVITASVQSAVLLERHASALVPGASVAMVMDRVDAEQFAASLAGRARRNPLGGLVRQVRRTPQGQ